MTDHMDSPAALEDARDQIAQDLKDGGVPRELWAGYQEAALRLTTVAEINDMVDAAISEH